MRPLHDRPLVIRLCYAVVCCLACHLHMPSPHCSICRHVALLMQLCLVPLLGLALGLVDWGKGRAAALQCCWRALNSLLYMAAATLSTKVVLNSRPGIGSNSPLCRCSAHGGCRCCAYLLHTVGSTQCAWTCHCSAAAVRLCGCVQLAMRLLRLCCRLQLQPQLGQMPLPAVLTQRQHRQLQVQLAMLAGEREGWGTSWSTYSNRTHWCATFSGVMSLHCLSQCSRAHFNYTAS